MDSLITLIQEKKYNKIHEGLSQGLYDLEETNENNSTAFIFAASQGDFNLLNNLYKAGCNIHHINNMGVNALIACCHNDDKDFEKTQTLLKVFSLNNVKFNQLIDFFKQALNDSYLSDSYNETLKQKISEEIIRVYGKEIKACHPQQIVEQFARQPVFLNEYFKLFEHEALDKHPVIEILKIYLSEPEHLFKKHAYFGFNAQNSVIYDKEINALIKEVGQQTEDMIAQEKPLLEGLKDIIKHFCKEIYRSVPDTLGLIKNMNQAYNECPEHTYYNMMTQIVRCENIEDIKKWMMSANLSNKEQYLDAQQQEKIEHLVNQYNLRGLYIDKSCNVHQVLSNLEKAFKDITVFFQIRDDEIGNSELKISIEKNQDNISVMSKETVGGYNSVTDTIFATETSKMSSILLHEYTHYLQHLAHPTDRMTFKPGFDNSAEWKNIEEILKNTVIKEEEIIQLMPDYVQSILNTPLSNKQKKEIMDMTDKTLKGQYSEEQIVKHLESMNIDTIYDIRFFFDNKLKEYISAALIDKYPSFDYNYWYLKDNGKEKGYWQQPVEIHARLNQDLFDFHSGEPTLTRTSLNASVEALKLLNKNMVKLSRETIFKRDEKPSVKVKDNQPKVNAKQIGNKILKLREVNSENDADMDSKKIIDKIKNA